MFPAAVPADADTGVAIRYGIDNHTIILLVQKEKRWIFLKISDILLYLCRR